MRVTPDSILFITVDSCRYDTFAAADAPAMKSVSALYKAQAPAHFTYASHMAMFAGFTPGVAELEKPFLNPKFARLFRLDRAGAAGHARPGFSVSGDDIVSGFRNARYATVGAAAMGWFDPKTPVSKKLTGSFEQFLFTGDKGVKAQLAFIEKALSRETRRDLFVFLNLGETHVPYYFEGAPWDRTDNPCLPFQKVNRAEECRERQRLSCEYLDRQIAPLLEQFSGATIIVCGDHGDCWGEDGLWEHGIAHPMTLTVPLLMRYRGRPVEEVV